MSKSSIKILVCYHKPACLYKSNLFIPIHVGRALGPTDRGINTQQYQWLRDHMIGDDTGDNISYLNRHFCELTAVYWAWKNYDKLGNPDYIGLSHYRRLFSPEDIKTATRYDITAPFEYIAPGETMLEQFVRAHYTDDLTKVLELLKNQYPAYAPAVKHFFSQRGSYFFNMFIMKKELFFEYCSMLFSILLPFHAQINYASYTPYNQRMPGFLGERLTSVFIARQQSVGHLVKNCRAVCWLDKPLGEQGKWRDPLTAGAVFFQYYRYRVLSHITWGEGARHYKEKRDQYATRKHYVKIWWEYRNKL